MRMIMRYDQWHQEGIGFKNGIRYAIQDRDQANFRRTEVADPCLDHIKSDK